MGNVKNIVNLLKSLSSETRIELLRIISEKGALSAAEAFREYSTRHKPIRRESIYRELEKMVEAGILDKRYCKNSKRLLYSANISALIIRLERDIKIEIVPKKE